MSDRESSRTLTLIAGQGQRGGHRTGHLMLLKHVAMPIQLGLSGVAVTPARVVSLGLDATDFETFRDVLHRYAVRHIVDIRLLASFRGPGFRQTPVACLLSELDITYERMPELGNRFLGEIPDERVAFAKFQDYLLGRKDAVGVLCQRLVNGTVLLLGRAPEHQYSERDAVIRVLATLGRAFELVAVSALTGTVRQVLEAPTCPTPSPAPSKRKRKRSPEHAGQRTLGLDSQSHDKGTR